MQVPAFIQKLAAKVKPWNQKQFGDMFAFAYCINGEVVFPVSGYCSLSFRLRYPEELEGHGFYLPLLRTVPGILDIKPEYKNGAITYFSSAPLFTGVVEPVIRPDDVKKVFFDPLGPNVPCAYIQGKVTQLQEATRYTALVERADTIKLRAENNPNALHVTEIFKDASLEAKDPQGFFDAELLRDNVATFQSLFKKSEQAKGYDVQLQTREGAEGRPELMRLTLYSDTTEQGSILLAGIRSKNG